MPDERPNDERPNDERPNGRPAGRVAVLVDQVTLWLASAIVAGVLQLWLARALLEPFSVTRWGWASRDLSWIVPLAHVVVYLPMAILLGVVAVAVGARLTLRASVWVWLTLGLFSILLLLPQIHGYASLLLAAGLALVISRRVEGAEARVRLGARVTAAVGSIALLLAATLVPRLRAQGERAAIAALPALPTTAPNVLILILDTVRADYLSLYGSSVETTPKLTAWASRGAVFEQAYSTSSWTTPSHASLFTGQYAGTHLASYTVPLADEHVTLAEVLRARGWATGGFTANFAATPRESGLAQGFLHYEDLKFTRAEVLRSTTITQSDNVLRGWSALSSGQGVRGALKRFLASDFTPRVTESAHDQKPAAEVSLHFLRWLDQLPDGRPFFAFLNYFDAHAPYMAPEPYNSMFRSDGPRDADRYRGAIRYLDDQLDSLFTTLEQRGILDNTIVVITSDHGEQFGEHEQWAHANSLYRQVVHVPLVILFPARVPAGQRVARQASGRDIAATILDLAQEQGDPAIGGVSLASAWRDSTARFSDVMLEIDQNMRPVLRFRNSLGPMKAILDDTLHVIRDGVGRYEAYAYRNDPEEREDLVAARGDSVAFARHLQDAVQRHQLSWPRAAPVSGRRVAADSGQ